MERDASTVEYTRFDDVAGPFGSPEGAWGDLTHQIVPMPAEYRGIGRDPSDPRIRIVAGPLGSGKSLLVRRMQDFQSNQHARTVYAPAVQRSSDLRTEDAVNFTKRIGAPLGNSELWKLLWRRSLMRSLVTYLRADMRSYLPAEADSFFSRYSGLLGSPDRGKRLVVHEVKQLIEACTTGREYRLKLDHDDWAEIENFISSLLSTMPPVFIYLDEIDREFKSAPSAWTLCQKGLLYMIMDLQRESEFQGRLHVVAALRDTTISSVASSEQAQRVLDPTYINLMNWGRNSARYFFEQKIARLPNRYFVNPEVRDAASLIGFEAIEARRPGAAPEPTVDYVLRHTSMVPRDIIRMGNRICDHLDRASHSHDERLSPQTLREIVALQSAGFANKLLAVSANQVLSDILPPEWWRKGQRLDPYDLNWARDRVLECIEFTGTEVVEMNKIVEMDAAATRVFDEYSTGARVHLADILWQNRLICAVYDDGEGRYYDLDAPNPLVSLPRVGGVSCYVWNPLLFDVTSKLELRLPISYWPH